VSLVGARWALRVRGWVSALRRSGTRAVLALTAVGLGCAATMVTLALAAGAERELDAASRGAGRDLLMVAPAQVLAPVTRGGGWYLSRRLDRDDVEQLEREVRGITAAAPVLEGQLRIELGRENTVAGVRGVTPAYMWLRRFEIARGRSLDESDDRERRRVALVGRSVAERLRASGGLVGRTLLIRGVPFEVVGVLAEKGMSVDGQDEDDQILVPLETARYRLFGAEWLSRVVLQATSSAAIPVVELESRSILRRRHRLAPGDPDDFSVVPMIRSSEIRQRGRGFLRGMSMLFAAVTLGVGGVGVLAVSYLNVRDRTAEIGLRRAVGARRRDIAGLFVGESCLLSLAGGVAGVGGGTLAVWVLERALGWQLAIDLRAVAAPLALSLALGLAFGVVPALGATWATPIEALRDVRAQRSA